MGSFAALIALLGLAHVINQMKMQIGDLLVIGAVCEHDITAQLFFLDNMPCNKECVGQIRGVLHVKLSDILDIFLWENDIMEMCFLRRELDCDCLVRFENDERYNTRDSLYCSRSKQSV